MKRFFIALLAVLGISAARAQDMGTVVQSCGNVAQQYAVGSTRPIQVDTNGNLCIAGGGSAGSGGGGYPANSIPITGNATGSTGAVVGTLAATPGRFTYICGLAISAVGSAAGAVGPITVAGIVGSSMVYQLAAGATPAAGQLTVSFTPCIPSSAQNTAITTTTTADATGTAIDVNTWGFQQ